MAVFWAIVLGFEVYRQIQATRPKRMSTGAAA